MKLKKMKVKNRQYKCTKKRLTTTTTATTIHNLKFHVIGIILVYCLLNVNAVNAYFNRTDALVNRYDYDYDTYADNEPILNSSSIINNHTNKTGESHRNGKFLFDALFGIEQNIEYDDVSEGDTIKTCNCGKLCFGLIIEGVTLCFVFLFFVSFCFVLFFI